MYQPYPGSDTQLPETQRQPILVWLVALTAVVFLWRRDSSAYFKASTQ